MEPVSGILKRPGLRRPFPVRPFLSNYSIEQLSQFFRGYLDPPFNTQFARFAEVVSMTGSDFVRLTQDDLRSICPVDCPYICDLAFLQVSLTIPTTGKSPHVRDIFSPAPVHRQLLFQRDDIDIFGPDADTAFDFLDDQIFPNSVLECLVPLPPSPIISPLPPLAITLSAMTGATSFSCTDEDEIYEDEHESLIDMFSPVSPSLGCRSEADFSEVSDIFDSPHLNSLCSPHLTLREDGEVHFVDIIGLGLHSPASEGEWDEEDTALIDSEVNGVEAASADSEDASTGNESPVGDNDHSSPVSSGWSSPVQGPTPFSGTPQFPGALLDSDNNETGSPQRQDPSPLLSSPEKEFADENDGGHDHLGAEAIHDVEKHDGEVGLSSFMSGLRSLDSRSPSPTPESPYSPLSLLHTDALSGGVLGLSVSPDFTIIQTPILPTSSDNALIASPSRPMQLADGHGYRPPFDGPEQVVPKPLAASAPNISSTEGVKYPSPPPSPAQTNAAAPTEAPASTLVEPHPKITITIPDLPSFFQDAELSCYISSAEMTRFLQSASGPSSSSLVAPWASSTSSLQRSTPYSALSFPMARVPSGAGGSYLERVVWPMEEISTGRYLPSPHMRSKHNNANDTSSAASDFTQGSSRDNGGLVGATIPARGPRGQAAAMDPPSRVQVPPTPVSSGPRSSWTSSFGGLFRNILPPTVDERGS